MKRFTYINLMVIAASAAALVVVIAALPTAKVTIVAIRPTSEVALRTNGSGEAVTGPEWLFGITNVGRANAYWSATVISRRLNDPSAGPPFPQGTDWKKRTDVQNGVLRPGEGVVTNIIVAAGDKMEWSGFLWYDTLMPPFQQVLWDFGKKTPGLRSHLPRRFNYVYSDPTWRPAASAPLAPRTATGSP